MNTNRAHLAHAHTFLPHASPLHAAGAALTHVPTDPILRRISSVFTSGLPMATFESTIYVKIWCSPCTVPRSSRACSTSEVPKTNDHGMLPYETITKVRSSPSHSHFHRLALPAHTALQTFPTFSAFFLSTAAPAGMLSAHSHDHRSVSLAV